MNYKEEILALCAKYGVSVKKARYYKKSPYEKARFKNPGEEVWLYVDKEVWTEKVCFCSSNQGRGKELEKNFCAYFVSHELWPDFVTARF